MVDLNLNHWSANRGAVTGDNGSYLLTGIPWARGAARASS